MISRILIANRGEIARRIMRTARALGIQTVAVFSDADADAPFVRDADIAVRLPGSTPADTYLRVDLIVDAARRTGADAVHPGYGFGSENADFAQAVIDAGLIWIGPAPETIREMGLKERAKAIAAEAGLPLAPSAALPDSIDDAGLAAAGARVGYPLLVKASAGGGGKGMRIVRDPADLADAVAGARREAASAFGDGTVFAERYVEGARHVEVQVFGDTHRNTVHLFERECSIQRRHQKVIEESPSPGVTEATRTALHAAAVALASTMRYVGAGTVEFLVAGEGEAQELYFLEMNTRLQVEHPVTEAVTGLDLVAWQIAVADGKSLPLRQEAITCTGHAIEARLYSEDPSADYLPGTGLINCFDSDPSVLGVDGLRIDAGVENGSVVTPYYDSMLAKVIAHAPDRTTATARLARGLQAMRIHGPVTNRDQLIAILGDADFAAGRTTTDFLDRRDLHALPVSDETRLRHAVAIALDAVVVNAPALGIPLGWSNVPQPPVVQPLRLRADTESAMLLLRRARSGLQAALVAGHEQIDPALFAQEMTWHDVCVDGARLEIDGIASQVRICVHDDTAYVDDGLCSTTWTLLPRFAADDIAQSRTHPATPVPGTITAVDVAPGDSVVAGQSLVVLEAMKMEHRITAPFDAVVVSVAVRPGQAVDAHQIVVELKEQA